MELGSMDGPLSSGRDERDRYDRRDRDRQRGGLLLVPEGANCGAVYPVLRGAGGRLVNAIW